ncbi:threonine export protein RhtC [Tatumella citrea]|uniref:Threonine export protein RhtC n=1 Tax=Tatumella citrea TaxID=53336 RepID=A0A1Y0LPX9_TATCI|nr:threonine export protein RhtC [Tatumella citrea]ARU95567.1 threonine export protein RhtC [Tatumella citrea]ARU99608.1 threonine export protein RhtC [Tatumella citrea]
MLMSFLTLALVHLLALMSPGPDFFFISQTAISRSSREALMGVLGVTLGVAVWAAVALLGLNLLLEKMAWLHQVIMLGGGLYLLWMGYQLLRAARRQHLQPQEQQIQPETGLAKQGRTFLKGLLTNLSNPKVVIYFGSVFSLFVGNDVSSLQRWGIYLLILLETLGWFMLVATVFALPWMRRKYQRLGKWLDGVGGVLFTAFGLHLILSR